MIEVANYDERYEAIESYDWVLLFDLLCHSNYIQLGYVQDAKERGKEDESEAAKKASSKEEEEKPTLDPHMLKLKFLILKTINMFVLS